MIGPPPIVPREFVVPMKVETKDFILKPLGWNLTHLDFEAYMSSVAHLQATFDLDGDSLEIDGQRWPAGSDLEFAFVDTAWCQFEWQHLRSSFSYVALAPDESQEIACGYIFRSKREGFLIECQTWVRASLLDSGFDSTFYDWFRNWVETEWPYDPQSIAWPGRTITWDAWNALPNVLPDPWIIK
jgi:hypothetical protein